MAAVDLGCWCRQGGDGKLKIAHSAEPGNQRAELLQAFPDEPTRCFSSCGMKCQGNNAELCQGGRDGVKGRGSPPHHVFWSLPQHVPAAWRVFSREKRRLSRLWPTAALCEQQGAVCTTTALLFSVCALPSTAEPALSQGLVRVLGRHRPDHKALPLPQSHPRHCQSGAGLSHERLVSLHTLRSYLVLHPACSTSSQIPLQGEKKCGGLHDCNMARASPWKNRTKNNNRADAKWDFLCSFVWFPWCAVQQTHGLVLAQKQEKVLMWLRSGDPSSNSRTFPTSQPVLLPCNPTSLSHASMPGASTWNTLLQKYHEERAVTPDLTWDSKEGELALSPAFLVCIGSKKK